MFYTYFYPKLKIFKMAHHFLKNSIKKKKWRDTIFFFFNMSYYNTKTISEKIFREFKQLGMRKKNKKKYAGVLKKFWIFLVKFQCEYEISVLAHRIYEG